MRVTERLSVTMAALGLVASMGWGMAGCDSRSVDPEPRAQQAVGATQYAASRDEGRDDEFEGEFRNRFGNEDRRFFDGDINRFRNDNRFQHFRFFRFNDMRGCARHCFDGCVEDRSCRDECFNRCDDLGREFGH
jgi:hypothetical protein